MSNEDVTGAAQKLAGSMTDLANKIDVGQKAGEDIATLQQRARHARLMTRINAVLLTFDILASVFLGFGYAQQRANTAAISAARSDTHVQCISQDEAIATDKMILDYILNLIATGSRGASQQAALTQFESALDKHLIIVKCVNG
jgi:hypothetical protein